VKSGNKVADIIDEFVKENNHLAHEEARRCCKGCEMDDPSQDHHGCMMSEEEEIGDWIYHYEMAKKFIYFDKLWTVYRGYIFAL